MIIKEMVHANLDFALENGYDVRGWPPEDIVVDLQCFASDCEEVDAEALLPHVESWLAEQRAVQ